MISAFLDNIQIDELENLYIEEEMIDLHDDMWESVTESEIEDWSFVEYEIS